MSDLEGGAGSNGGVEDGNSVNFDYTPHYKTLVDKKSHFSRISDSISEFVDNSIQATRKNELKRLVRIGCFVTNSKTCDEGFLAVADNGCGMDEADIKNFATYSFDQASRGQCPDSSNDKSFISKFGVGAKEAGFFLGDTLCVITKQAERNHVLETMFSEKEYEKRYTNNQSVYSGTVHRRLIGSDSRILNFSTPTFEPTPALMYCGSQSLQQFISATEQKWPSFSVILVQLRKQQAVKFHKRCESIKLELADTYHFHLFPENKPNKIVTWAKFQHTSKAMSDVPKPSYIRDRDESEVELPPLDISFDIYHDTQMLSCTQSNAALSEPLNISVSTSLKDIQGNVSLNVDRAAAAFRFNMKMPDPQPSEEVVPTDVRTQTIQRTLAGEMTGGVREERLVQGIIFYYPFVDGAESKPRLLSEPKTSKRKGSLNAGQSSSSSSSSSSTRPESSGSDVSSKRKAQTESVSEPDKKRKTQTKSVSENAAIVIEQSDSGDDADDKYEEVLFQPQGPQPIFSVYWQDRLVPETVLSKLPFFPVCLTAAQCEADKLSLNWRYRLKGYLFFDWTFHHISNNKLKFTIEPSLDEWLNGLSNKAARSRDLSWNPVSTLPMFKRFLQGCHKCMDKELKYDLRDIEGERKYNDKREMGASYVCMFKRIVVGNGVFRLEAGKIVKLAVTGTGRGGGMRKLFGRIISFDVHDKLPENQPEHFGPAKIRFIREPESVYGPEELETTVAALGTMNVVEEVTKAELKQLDALAPKKVVFTLFTEGSEAEVVAGGDEVNNLLGHTYVMIGVQLFDGKNSMLFSKPHTQKQKDHYKVKFTFGDYTLGQPTDVLWKTTDGVVMDDIDVARNKMKDKAVSGNIYFGAFKVNCGNPGSFLFMAQVLDGSRPVLESKVMITTRTKPANPVSKAVISGDFVGIFPFGALLPTFQIEFQDDSGNVVKYTGQMKISIEAESMDTTCDDVVDPVFQIDEEDEGKIIFEEGQWKSVPAERLSDTDESSAALQQDVVFNVNLYRQDGDNDADFSCKMNNLPLSFTMRFCPGPPVELRLLSIGSNTAEDFAGRNYVCEVENNDVIPDIRLGCFDKWNNATGPDAGQLWKCLFGPHWSRWGPGHSAGSQQVFDQIVPSTGSVDIKNMYKISVPDGGPLCGTIVVQTIELQMGDEVCARLDIPILVKPILIPTTIQVLHEGSVLAENNSFVCGTELKDLELQLLDQNKGVMQLENFILNTKYSGIKTSWGGEGKSKKSKKVKSSSPHLPNIKLDLTFTDLIELLDFDVQCTLQSYGDLSFDFNIRVLPDAPISWKIFTSPRLTDDGIRCASEEDLHAQIVGLFLVDVNGNRVSVPKAAQLDDKSLRVLWGVTDDGDSLATDEDTVNDEQGKKNSIESQLFFKLENAKAISNSSNPCFSKKATFMYYALMDDQKLLPPATSNEPTDLTLPCRIRMEGPLMTGSTTTTSQSSSSTQYNLDAMSCDVCAGLPFEVRLSSSSLQIDTPTNTLTKPIDVNNYHRVGDLEFHIFDISGNYASMNRIKSGTIQIGCGGNSANVITKVGRVKNSCETVPGFGLSKLFHLTAEEETVLTCSFTYSYGNEQKTDVKMAVLPCALRHVNVVEKISIVTSHLPTVTPSSSENDMDVEEAQQTEDAVFSFTVDDLNTDGDLPFKFHLRMKTGDNEEFQPSELLSESLEFSLSLIDPSSKRSNRKNGSKSHAKDTHPIDFDSMFSVSYPPMTVHDAEDDLKGPYAIIMPSRDTADVKIPVGTYSLSVTYTEKRKNLLSLPNHAKTCSGQFMFRSCPGAMTAILLDETSLQSFDNAVATNDELAAYHERVIASNVVVNATDSFGNLTVFPESFDVMCYLQRSDSSNGSSSNGSKDNANLPMLRYANQDRGFLLGSVDSERRMFSFQSLELTGNVEHGDGENRNTTNSCGGDGRINVIFSCHGGRAIEPIMLSFSFVSDQGRVQKAAELKKILDSLVSDVMKYDNEELELQRKLLVLDRDMTVVLAKAEGKNLKKFQTDSQAVSHTQMATLADELVAQHKDMAHNISEIRSSAKLNDFPSAGLLVGYESLGLVVDLAFVNDFEIAFVLAWAAQWKINCLVVSDSDTANALYKRGVKVWALDQIIPFRSSGERRTTAQMSKGELPLRPIAFPRNSTKSGEVVPGNPEYMVNVICLNGNNEHLRDTVFYAIYREKILFDDISSASLYRKTLVGCGITPADFYTRDGKKLSSDGILNPGVGSNRVPVSLDFVYGQQNPTSSDEYRCIEADLTVAGELQDMLAEKEEVQRKLEELQDWKYDRDDKDAKADQIRRDLTKLNGDKETVQTSYAHVTVEKRKKDRRSVDYPDLAKPSRDLKISPRRAEKQTFRKASVLLDDHAGSPEF